MAAVQTAKSIPWWKEPTRDQWYAWWAAWLGWTLDAFDFTVFLLIMAPIAKEFDVPLTAVAFVLTITLWMRLVGAVGAGWLADRMHPLVASGEEVAVKARHIVALLNQLELHIA